ncbi:hypothetical protein H2198_008230 [Neophaeococcomyces mojaviensis]|uniref:Uncharacterized protein n=1 Tax=Neophaeococcomyces mojaviensis TaxID=3383035 RepID=A0ACC2ZXS4_9EURO|nr:hypothetical protein H2198_008230 [Knufia sp. JES_112]
MNSTSLPSSAMKVLGRIGFEIYKTKPLLPTYLHLLVSATFPIVTAAHASLRRPISAAPVRKSKTKKTARHDDDEEEKSSKIESLTLSDAILFPVLAGCTLTALYLIIKWLEDPAILNKILGYYFSWIGLFFCSKYIKDVLYFVRSWLFPAQYSRHGLLYTVDSSGGYFLATKEDGTQLKENSILPGFLSSLRLPSRLQSTLWKTRRALYYKLTCVLTLRKPLTPGKTTFNLTFLDLAAALASAGIGLYQNFFSDGKLPWYLTNLVGTSFCYTSLQIMTPGTAGIGSLLLSLLFFYDIYMVFFTPMMITVATKLDVPIKLLFPRPHEVLPEPYGALPDSQEMQEYLESLAKKKTMAMLGLGDIVVPGIMIAFALRFDLYQYYLKLKVDKTEHENETVENEEVMLEKDTRPQYSPARGSWAERFYTSFDLWSPLLKAKSFPKPYFKASVAGYIAGMVATLLVMQIWKHGQPALLYLVPGVLTSIWGMALWKGELKLLWAYDETEEEKIDEKKAAAVKKDTEEKDKAKADDKEENDTVTAEDEEVDTQQGESQSTDGKRDGKKNTAIRKDDNMKTRDDINSGLRSIISFHVCIPTRFPSDSSTSGTIDYDGAKAL